MPSPAPSTPGAEPRRRVVPSWGVLAGAWIGVPVAIGALTALIATTVSCSEDGLAVLVLMFLLAIVVAIVWPLYSRARPWWLCGAAMVGGSVLGSMAAVAGWAAVGVERCFTY
jgi:hypothetical protein